jgi:uncharacterized protein
MKKLFYILTPILLILLFIPWYFSSLVLYPPVNCNPEHHVFCDTPKELGLDYEEVQVVTEDGISLPSWFIPAIGSKKGIVLVHGHGGSRNEGLRFASALNKAGFNLLLLSLRRNAGEFASMGFHEIKDAKAGVKFLSADRQLDSIGIFGFSMGAATSIITMEEEPLVKAGLFSSGYASAMDVLSEAANRDFGIPYYPLIPVVQLYLNVRGDMNIETVRPVDKIGSISPRPIAIFHCIKDDYVDVSHSDRLFSKAKEPKEIWIPICERHERIWNSHKDEAEKRAVGFFKKNL